MASLAPPVPKIANPASVSASKPDVSLAATANAQTAGMDLRLMTFGSSISTPNIDPRVLETDDLKNSWTHTNATHTLAARAVEAATRGLQNSTATPNFTHKQVVSVASQVISDASGGLTSTQSVVDQKETERQIWLRTKGEDSPSSTSTINSQTEISKTDSNDLLNTSFFQTDTANVAKESDGKTIAVAGEKAGAVKEVKVADKTKRAAFTNMLPKNLEERLSTQTEKIIALTSGKNAQPQQIEINSEATENKGIKEEVASAVKTGQINSADRESDIFTNMLPKNLEERLSTQTEKIIALTSGKNTQPQRGNPELLEKLFSGTISLINSNS